MFAIICHEKKTGLRFICPTLFLNQNEAISQRKRMELLDIEELFDYRVARLSYV